MRERYFANVFTAKLVINSRGCARFGSKVGTVQPSFRGAAGKGHTSNGATSPRGHGSVIERKSSSVWHETWYGSRSRVENLVFARGENEDPGKRENEKERKKKKGKKRGQPSRESRGPERARPMCEIKSAFSANENHSAGEILVRWICKFSRTIFAKQSRRLSLGNENSTNNFRRGRNAICQEAELPLLPDFSLRSFCNTATLN